MSKYTAPMVAVATINKYLPANSVIWCPFDLPHGNFVEVLKVLGHTVLTNDINDHVECDYIIGYINGDKTDTLDKLYSLDKPFAMLVSANGITDNQNRFNMFSKYPFEIMFLNKRLKLIDENNQRTKPYHLCYICSKLLPQQVLFEYLDIEYWVMD